MTISMKLSALFAVGRITKFALKVMHLLNCLFNFFFVLPLPVLVWDLAFSYLRHAGGSSYSLPIGYSINVACGFFKICKCQMKKKKKFKQTNKTETIQSTIEFVVKIFRDQKQTLITDLFVTQNAPYGLQLSYVSLHCFSNALLHPFTYKRYIIL